MNPEIRPGPNEKDTGRALYVCASTAELCHNLSGITFYRVSVDTRRIGTTVAHPIDATRKGLLAGTGKLSELKDLTKNANVNQRDPFTHPHSSRDGITLYSKNTTQIPEVVTISHRLPVLKRRFLVKPLLVAEESARYTPRQV